MSDLLHTIGLGIGVPAAISLATALIARRILLASNSVTRRQSPLPPLTAPAMR